MVVFVGNNAKLRVSRRVFQGNKARQVFRKTNISDSLIRAHIRDMLRDSHKYHVTFPDSHTYFFSALQMAPARVVHLDTTRGLTASHEPELHW